MTSYPISSCTEKICPAVLRHCAESPRATKSWAITPISHPARPSPECLQGARQRSRHWKFSNGTISSRTRNVSAISQPESCVNGSATVLCARRVATAYCSVSASASPNRRTLMKRTGGQRGPCAERCSKTVHGHFPIMKTRFDCIPRSTWMNLCFAKDSRSWKTRFDMSRNTGTPSGVAGF